MSDKINMTLIGSNKRRDWSNCSTLLGSVCVVEFLPPVALGAIVIEHLRCFITLLANDYSLINSGNQHNLRSIDPSSLRSVGMTDGRGRLLGMTKQSKTAKWFNINSPV